MKSLPKLIRRFVGILMFSASLLFILNIVLLGIVASTQMPNAYPWKTAQETAENLRRDGDGYDLSDEMTQELRESDVWAIFIDNASMEVVWQTDDLPETVPMSYSASDIARLTRGYLADYPTFTGEAEDGLAVLGYPKDSFWKHMWPSWDYQFIANLPKTFFSVLLVNAAMVFLIYMAANTSLLRSVRPITDGIQALPSGEAVYIKEKGLLCELAMSINKTSELLQSQSSRLRRKETARANWIAGVSHDIRTPLSMVMGYADQLREDPHLTGAGRQKAAVIVKQSERMRNLINDLNLASRLEYNMQPVHLQTVNLIAAVRQVVVDFMNMDIDGRHPVEWETEEALTVCPVRADPALMKRAISNLIQNCINHNEQGCTIYVCVSSENGTCTVAVADDGVGMSEEQMETLSRAPHYMVCDERTAEQRHGLGLLIVKQIMAAHGGEVRMEQNAYGGFTVKLRMPVESQEVCGAPKEGEQ